MEVVNPRSALLSNFEVLTLLREHESDQLARTKNAIRIKKEEEQAGLPINPNPPEEVSENLRTVEFEAIAYLSASYHPTASQSEASILQLVKALAPFSLTKAEKLQIVNLVPKDPVELYVIVEELEDRLKQEELEKILSVVRESSTDLPSEAPHLEEMEEAVLTYPTETARVFTEEELWDRDAEHDEFDDTGEGAGVEGDLDMEED